MVRIATLDQIRFRSKKHNTGFNWKVSNINFPVGVFFLSSKLTDVDNKVVLQKLFPFKEVHLLN